MSRILWGIAISVLFLCVVQYIIQGRKRKLLNEKILMYGFACFFAGCLICYIIINFIRDVSLPGYYIDHGYNVNTDDLEQFPITLYFKLFYIALLVGTFLLIFAIEYNIKRTKYIITGANTLLLIWYMIAATSLSQIVQYFGYIWGLNILVLWITLFYFTKWAKEEFRAISAFLYFGTWMLLISLTLSSPDIRTLDIFPLSLPPIMTIIGSLICLVPTLIKPGHHIQARIYWIIIGFLSIIIMGFIVIFTIIQRLPFIYLVMGTVLEVTVIIILYKMIILTRPTSIKESKEEHADILSAFTRPSKVTEEEVSVAKEKKICLVCKGKVARNNIFLCPECDTFYCSKCSGALSDLENACWVCETPFDESKPVKLPDKKEEEVVVEGIDQKKEKKK